MDDPGGRDEAAAAPPEQPVVDLDRVGGRSGGRPHLGVAAGDEEAVVLRQVEEAVDAPVADVAAAAVLVHLEHAGGQIVLGGARR